MLNYTMFAQGKTPLSQLLYKSTIFFDAFILISSPKVFGDMCYETDFYKFKKYLSSSITCS